MATLLSTIYTTAGSWLSHNPGYAACQALVGNAVGTGSEGVATAITNIAVCSPVLLTCVMTDDPDHIYVVHSPRKFIPDPLKANTYDNMLSVSVGMTWTHRILLCFPPAKPSLALETLLATTLLPSLVLQDLEPESLAPDHTTTAMLTLTPFEYVASFFCPSLPQDPSFPMQCNSWITRISL